MGSNTKVNSAFNNNNNSLSSQNQVVDDEEDDDGDCWKDASEKLIPNDHSKPEDESSHNFALASYSSAYSSFQPNQLASKITPASTNSDCDSLILHEAIFKNENLTKYCKILRLPNAGVLVNKKDKHGNTPLHLACMLGRSTKMVAGLLNKGAYVDCKNLNRWTPFHEACSYGNRDIITMLTIQLRRSIYETIDKTKLSDQLGQTKNYRLTLKWEFKSWVPFLSRVLPNDVCVITKHGRNIRIDTRLLELASEMFPWRRTDGCLIHSDKLEQDWVLLNNRTKKYQFLDQKLLIGRNIYHKVDEFMSTDIIDFELKSSNIQLTRSTCGLIWRADKVEKIGKYNASLYDFDNLVLVTRKRREHLSEDDLKKNKMLYKSAMNMFRFGKGSDDNEEDCDNTPLENQNASENQPETYRESLPPPPPTNVTWEQYLQSAPGEHPVLGREHKCKVVKTAFKANVAMSQEFPISVSEFIDLISIIPLKLFKKLNEFIEMKLPDGFPIRLDIPIFSFLAARITFEDFNFIDGPIDESLFSIPSDFTEDPEMLSMFAGRTRETASNEKG